MLPEVTEPAFTGTWFHAPAVGEEKVPEVTSAPGCPLLLEYRPAISVVAWLCESTYTLIEETDPDACAVKGKASAQPAEFVSTNDSTV